MTPQSKDGWSTRRFLCNFPPKTCAARSPAAPHARPPNQSPSRQVSRELGGVQVELGWVAEVRPSRVPRSPTQHGTRGEEETSEVLGLHHHPSYHIIRSPRTGLSTRDSNWTGSAAAALSNSSAHPVGSDAPGGYPEHTAKLKLKPKLSWTVPPQVTLPFTWRRPVWPAPPTASDDPPASFEEVIIHPIHPSRR